MQLGWASAQLLLFDSALANCASKSATYGNKYRSIKEMTKSASLTYLLLNSICGSIDSSLRTTRLAITPMVFLYLLIMCVANRVSVLDLKSKASWRDIPVAVDQSDAKDLRDVIC